MNTPSTSTVPATPAKDPRQVLTVLAAIAVLVVGAVSFGLALRGPATLTVSGSVELQDASGLGSDPATGRSACVGTGGFDGVGPGAAVTIRDAAGAVVAIGLLQPGEPVGTACAFPFEVAGVPGDSGFYEVQVAHRAGVTFAREQLAEPVTLTLG